MGTHDLREEREREREREGGGVKTCEEGEKGKEAPKVGFYGSDTF